MLLLPCFIFSISHVCKSGGNWEIVREKAIYVELTYQTLSLSPSPDRPYLDLLRKHEKAIQASERERERERGSISR